MAKKRSHGEGSVYKRKNGTWRGQLMDGYTSDGKRNIVSFSALSKAEVLQKIREYLAQKEHNVLPDRKSLLEQWAECWYVDMKGQVQDSTYCGYRYTLNIILKYLGKKKLASLVPLDINLFYRELEKTYSNSQITKCRAMLIQIFDAACDNGLVARNPARHSKKLKAMPFEYQRERDAFTDDEVAFLMDNLEDDMTGNSIRLLLGTGLRVQELLALTKEDISPDGTFITVNKAVKTVNGKSELGPPKSKKGIRIVPVPAEYQQYAIYVREHGRRPYLWTQSYKNPLCATKTFRKKYQRAVASFTEVRHLTPHCCRHTYITRLQAHGVPMETIARLVGHSNIQTTDNYLHTPISTLQDAVSKLELTTNKEIILMTNTKTISYMDVWYAELPVNDGHVQYGRRPVVIVSNNAANAHSPVVTVVPLTSKLNKKALPTHVYLQCGGLRCLSLACCEQVMALDKSCLIQRVGAVSDHMKRMAIQYALAIQLNIQLQVNLAA